MKLWLLLSRFEVGGLERVQANLAPGLAKAGLNPWIVAGRLMSGAKALLPSDVPFLEFARRGRLFFIGALFSQLRTHRPDVVMTTSNDVACLMLILRAMSFSRMKVICTQHLSISGPLEKARGVQRFKLWVTARLMSRLLPKADAIVAVSNALADDMRTALGLDVDISVIHNPVMLPDFFQRMNEQIHWPWADYAEPTIIFVGRLASVKRVDLLLDAYQRVVKRLPVRLLILGDGPEREAIQRQIAHSEASDKVRMVGFQENPLPWIKASDILVLSSDYEGFGMVLVEAMACSTQVVSTNCPDGPAEVLDNGRYGRLVPTGDAAALAGAIQACLEGDRVPEEKLILRARQFGLEAAVNEYLSLIKRVHEAGR